MLRLLKNLLRSGRDRRMTHLGFLTERELADMCGDLGRIFDAEALKRDYENEWEWLEGVSRRGFSINVSRTHDWSVGDHHLPVLVALTRDDISLERDELRTWATKLAASFGVDVSIGYIADTKSEKYRLDADEVYHAPQKG